ncbi:MAG: sel1 repeat family protein [Polyangiaceae bacterium]|nr:sel1 repeat family protein [Polyangiaceae bacterium]
MFYPLRKLALGVASLAAVVACGNAMIPDTDDFVDDTDPQRARVTVAKNKSKPLIVDWTPENRSDLEVRASKGPAVVRFDERTFELLPDCHADGVYEYHGFTPQEELITLRSKAELHANLPAGAFELEGRLEQSGGLTVAIRMVGKHELDRVSVRRDQLRGRCEGATHVVRGMTVGAFRFMSGRVRKGQASASVFGRGGEVAAEGSRELLRSAGDFVECDKADPDAPKAPSRCRAVLRIEIVPLDGEEPAPQPAATAQGPLAPPKQDIPDCGEGLRWDGNSCVTMRRVEHEARKAVDRAKDEASAVVARGFVCKVDPNDATECLNQCKIGNMESCVYVGWYFALGSGGLAKDEAKAVKMWLIGCNAKVAKACTALSTFFVNRQEWVKALAFGGKGCVAGDPAACTRLGVLAYNGQGTRQNRPTAFKFWLRACVMRDVQACAYAGVMLMNGIEGAPRSQIAACRLYARACSGAGQAGCPALAEAMQVVAGQQLDAAAALQGYRSACASGVRTSELAPTLEELEAAADDPAGVELGRRAAAEVDDLELDGSEALACGAAL